MPTPKPPNKGGRPPKHGPVPKGRRSGRRLSIDVDPLVLAALARYQADVLRNEELKLSQTQLVEQGLRLLLAQKGYWPPKPRGR